jgi:glycosyltransferase involved in cell wall biosynthesis
MIIGIDGNEANIPKRVGVGRYAQELLKQLAKARGFHFQIYLKQHPLPDLPQKSEYWRYQVVGPPKLWTQFGLPLALCFKKPRPAVFFSPSHYAPRFSPCPKVVSVLDLAFIHFPQMFRSKDLWQLKLWTAYSVKKAVRVLTISESTKNDIIRYYSLPEKRVVVAYPGFSMKAIKRGQSLELIKKKYGLKGDYLLSVGTIQPRKNYPRLIEAFSKLPKKIGELVIVGKKGWLWEETLKAPQKYGVEARVKFLDYVSDENLSSLYQGAKCFILVSLYEGFGIPALEAMTYGCPVVVSNISSLPEVVGEAGVLVDPNNPTDIARGIKEAVADRQDLIKKGLVQCRQFSWEKTAKQTLAVLEEVGRGHV